MHVHAVITERSTLHLSESRLLSQEIVPCIPNRNSLPNWQSSVISRPIKGTDGKQRNVS